MKGSATSNTMNVFGFFVLIFYQKNGGAGGAVSPTKHKFLWRNKELSHRVIVIGNKNLCWDEFGDEVITFEGWSSKFKFSSLFILPEADYD